MLPRKRSGGKLRDHARVNRAERGSSVQRAEIQQAYLDVRQTTADLCRPLATEDYVVQPIDSVSPPKWHLGHTTWFFETFVLQPYSPAYRPYHPLYSSLLTSYYHHVGARWERASR